MSFKEKYGPVAIVAGASEGLGAAWAEALATRGLNLILIARRKEMLEQLALTLQNKYGVHVTALVCDLSNPSAAEQVVAAIAEMEVGLMVYNAALSHIGSFLENDVEEQAKLSVINMITPLRLVHHLGKGMIERRKGGVVLMSSLAGFQGSGYLSGYAATRAYGRVLAESLWYEWKHKGVDVIACCAGATGTPNYFNTKPGNPGFFAPKVQTPKAVVEECLRNLGKTPSFIPGRANRLAAFFMHKILPRKMAVNIMGDATRRMYGIE